MKKVVILLISVFCAIVSFAQDGNTVNVPMSEPTMGDNRGVIEAPVVSFSPADNSLTIEFESEDSYQLTIEDVYGITWYTSPVNTNGIPTIYYVNLPSDNTYTITISSTDVTFIGYLQL